MRWRFARPWKTRWSPACARDLQGRITYVNPAFCEMVGFTAQELLGYSTTAPASGPVLAPRSGWRNTASARLTALRAARRHGRV